MGHKIWFVGLGALEGVRSVIFDNCMRGGKRLKTTKLLTNSNSFANLAVRCDKQHYHSPWQAKLWQGVWKFDTSLEAAYPYQLCRTMAALVAEEVGVRHTPVPPPHLPKLAAAQRRAAAGRQPRGRVLPPTMPEFKNVVQCRSSHPPDAGTLIHSDTVFDNIAIPAGSKVLQVHKGEDAEDHKDRSARNDLECRKICELAKTDDTCGRGERPSFRLPVCTSACRAACLCISMLIRGGSS